MKLLIPFLFIVGMTIAAFTVFAADTGTVSPSSGTNDNSVGTAAWTNPGNVLVSDNSRANAGTGASVCGNTFTNVRLFSAGSATGDNKGTGQSLSGTDQITTFGGASDVWGAALSSSLVNDSSFGFAISVTGQSATSQYLLATGFGFSIPDGATIDGIEARVEGGCDSATARVDHMTMKVYYTETSPGTGPAASGTIRSSSVQVRSGALLIR